MTHRYRGDYGSSIPDSLDILDEIGGKFTCTKEMKYLRLVEHPFREIGGEASQK